MTTTLLQRVRIVAQMILSTVAHIANYLLLNLSYFCDMSEPGLQPGWLLL